MNSDDRTGVANGAPSSVPAAAASPRADLGQRIFDGLTVCVLILAPLGMGGRHPWGRLFYVLLVSAMALTWVSQGLRRGRLRYRPCGLEWGMMLATALILLQLMPLSPPWLRRLSPRTSHFLPLWEDATPLEPFHGWRTVSLVPARTRVGLAVWMAHAAFLLMLVQRLESRLQWRRTMCWIAVAGIGLATIGLLQYLFSNGKFLWIYQDPFRGTQDVVRGPFYNENHFAHFLTLALGPTWVWLLARRVQQHARRHEFTLRPEPRGDLATLGLTAALPTIAFAILLTRSRGGLIAVTAAVLLGALGMLRRGRLSWIHAVRFGIVLAVLSVALSIHGLDRVGHEVGTLTTTSLDELDQQAGRRRIWAAARDVLGQFTLCGAGVGSFRETFPLFYAEPRQVDYSYAESGYLQVAVETGLCGLGLLAAALLFVSRRLVWLWNAASRVDDWDWALAAAVGLGVSLLHSIFDFVWYLPACFSVTLALLAVLIRWCQAHQYGGTSSVYEVRLNRVSGAAAMITVSLVCLTSLGPLLSEARGSAAWHRYLLTSHSLPSAEDVEPVDSDMEALLELRGHLQLAAQQDPTHARAHLRLASLDLRIFEILQRSSDNPMSLLQIRDAALASRFASREAQDQWLEAAVGKNRRLLDEALDHVGIALALSPLQGAGYVYLAELAFLEFPGSPVHPRLIQQALRVRPYDPTVLFAAGREAIFAGDIARAVKFWRQAYRQDDELRKLITMQLAPQLPVELFVTQFQLPPSEIANLYQFYRDHSLDAQAADAGHLLLDRLTENPAEPVADSGLWRRAYSIAAELNDRRAIAVGRRAVQLDPWDYTMRRRLGFELLDRQDWSGGIEHLAWCAERNRADLMVATKLTWARRQMEANRVQAASYVGP